MVVDDDGDFFSSESFLEVVSGIADGLEEHEKKCEQLRSTKNEDECSEPPPHKPALLELAEMTEEEAAKALRNYQILCKRWTDKRLCERRSKLSDCTLPAVSNSSHHSPSQVWKIHSILRFFIGICNTVRK